MKMDAATTRVAHHINMKCKVALLQILSFGDDQGKTWKREAKLAARQKRPGRIWLYPRS
jgi:hypothetical protein